MKLTLAIGTLVLVAGSGGAYSAVTRARVEDVPQKVLVDLPGVGVTDMVMSPNEHFIYYSEKQGVMMYDRSRKRSIRLLTRDATYLAIARHGDVLAFAGLSEDGKQMHVYALALDTATGLAIGAARRVSAEQGDTPSLSPDGRWIAFAGYGSPDRQKQRLAVIPSMGGPERVLAQHDGGIEPIRWTPDGRWIYYGVGGKTEQTTYRIAVSGGAPTVFQKSQDVYPGLSPDGLLVVVNGTLAENSVYDSAGRQLGTYPSHSDRYSYTWSRPGNILAVVSPQAVLLQSFSLKTGDIKRLTLPVGAISEPRWSPDGRHIAIGHVSADGDTTELLVMNPDGSGQRRTPIPVRGIWVPIWSPDGQWVAYAGGVGNTRSIGATVIGVVEAATGRHITLAPGLSGIPVWTRDSKRLLIPVLADSSGDAGGKYRLQIHEMTLVGGDRVLGERRMNAFSFQATSDSTAATTPTPGGPGMFVPIAGGAAITTFPAGVRYSSVSASADGQWIAFRSGDADNFNTLHVSHPDGSNHTTIPLTFTALPGLGNPVFLPGNKELIVTGTTASPDSVAFYRIDIASKSIRRILAGRRAPRYGAQFTVSPDGSTLMYVTRIPPNSTIVELDLAQFLKRATR